MKPAPDLEVTSDASGSLGFGAYCGGEWFSGSWITSQAPQSIAYKEFFPVVIAAHLCGPHWAIGHILFRSDNEAVVSILNTRTPKIPHLMCLLCHLLVSAACFDFFFSSQHVPGIHDSVVDGLSRFHWQEFRRLAPEAQLLPVSIPPQLFKELTSHLQSNSASFFLVQGLDAPTRRSYSSGQRNFITFCAQMGKLHPSGFPCPTDEWTLCLFATFLARSVIHSSIKVYLSAVRSLLIEEGFLYPLVNCLRLQRVVQGIKRTQGSS